MKGVWAATCLTHTATATAANRTPAWKMGSTPSSFCPKCKAIAAGKQRKIDAGLLDVPAALAKATDAPGTKPVKPAPKATAKTAPAKPKETAAQRAVRIQAEGFAKDQAATKAGDAA